MTTKYQIIKISFLKTGEESYKIAPPLEERLKAKHTNKKNGSHNNQDKQAIEKPDDHA